MVLHLSHADPVPVRLAEPPVIALNPADDLSIWKFIDGMVVVRIGAKTEIGADSIAFERHHLRPTWMALKAIDEGEI
jgi:hypothetical protein